MYFAHYPIDSMLVPRVCCHVYPERCEVLIITDWIAAREWEKRCPSGRIQIILISKNPLPVIIQRYIEDATMENGVRTLRTCSYTDVWTSSVTDFSVICLGTVTGWCLTRTLSLRVHSDQYSYQCWTPSVIGGQCVSACCHIPAF